MLSKAVPIFIIVCDRLEALKKTILSYNNIKTQFEIVIIDFGSTYKPTIEFLKYLEWEGVRVYWKERIKVNVELNKVDQVVQDYFESHPRSNYVVTDPDVALDNVDGDILEVYSYLLENVVGFEVVGPMLRIDDIPDCYPRKEKLLSGSLHVDFHSRPVHTVRYEGKDVEYIFAPIDSTFGMSRAGTSWSRHQRGIRVLPPYAAQHLDWYLNPKNLTEDYKHYIQYASKGIAHWSIWGEEENER